MPNRGASRASGFINPADGLTYSGAIVAQVQSQTAVLGAQVNAAPNTGTPATSRAATQTNGGAGLADRTGSTESAGLASNAVLNPLGSSAPNTVSSSMQAEKDESARTGAAGNCEPSPDGAPYCVYEISERDTLGGIATRFGLKSGEYENWKVLQYSNNSVVTDPDSLSPGLKLRIPRGNGVIHEVTLGGTLADIAEQYGVSIDDIISANSISNPNSISSGQIFFVPNPTRFSLPVAAAPAPSPSSSSGSSGGSGTSSRNPATATGPRSASGLIWPVSGPISSYYGPNHPLGIDIDLFNGRSAAIAAAAGGVVTFAGGNSCCSYGLYVVIDHGNGMQTLYAHLSKIGVSVGQVVGQGQYLGNSGTTGYSTGEHLHFEVQVGGRVVNPLGYLP